MNSEPTLNSILPAATQEVVNQELNKTFRSTLKMPKGMNRWMVGRGIDQMILNGLPIEQVKAKIGLVASEVEYVTAVIDEYRAWEAINKPPATQPIV
jgi:hypothetical protein